MNVEDVIPTPACRVGVVLNGPQAPFGPSSHRINGNSAEESFLLTAAATVFDPFDECVEIWRVAFAAGFDADQVEVSRVLKVVDRVAHLAKIPAKLGFLCTDDRKPHDGKRRGREDEQNAGCDDQLEKGETRFSGEHSLTRSHSSPSTHACDAELPRLHASAKKRLQERGSGVNAATSASGKKNREAIGRHGRGVGDCGTARGEACFSLGLLAVGDPDIFHLDGMVQVPAAFALFRVEPVDGAAFVGEHLFQISH